MGTKERKIREKQTRRGQILSAARKLLLEKGIEATSINQIAKHAELGVGTIYFYYHSKEDLSADLKAQLDTHGNQILGHVRHSLDEGIALRQFRDNIEVRKTAVETFLLGLI